jgi:hypothetical protein
MAEYFCRTAVRIPPCPPATSTSISMPLKSYASSTAGMIKPLNDVIAKRRPPVSSKTPAIASTRSTRRVFVCPCRCGEIRDGLRAVREVIRNAELDGRLKRRRDDVTGRELKNRLSRIGLGLSIGDRGRCRHVPFR